MKATSINPKHPSVITHTAYEYQNSLSLYLSIPKNLQTCKNPLTGLQLSTLMLDLSSAQQKRKPRHSKNTSQTNHKSPPQPPPNKPQIPKPQNHRRWSLGPKLPPLAITTHLAAALKNLSPRNLLHKLSSPLPTSKKTKSTSG